MRAFKIIPGWAAVTAGVLLVSAVALAAPEQETEPTKSGLSELNADTMEYNMKTGQMTATGNVVIHYDGGVATGASATYNTKTSSGALTGGVVADKGDMHLDCDRIEFMSKTQIVAIGNVHGRKQDKQVVGPRVEYDSGEEYARMPEGGTLSTKDGSFTADYMEGWAKEERAKGIGNAHIVSPSKDFEGGGDEAEYFGKENGKLVLTGNAWAIRGNNMLKSGRMTVYLSERNKAETVTDENEAEQQ